MNIRRFLAPSAREAMLQLKAELGEDALVLANRKTEHGVEILATLDPKFDQLTRKSSASRPADLKASQPLAIAKKAVPVKPAQTHKPTMSTVSFQDYVRERLAQSQSPANEPVNDPTLPLTPRSESEGPREPVPYFVAKLPSVADVNESPAVWRGRPTPEHMPPSLAVEPYQAVSGDSPQLLAELREVKSMLMRQVDSATWLGGGSAQSARARRSHQLLDAGLSPGLVRYLVEHMPADLDVEQEQPWLEQTLERNCKKSPIISQLLTAGGVCALVGPTGVGKTTTIAKLAARAVLRQGAARVALVTLDNFRVGAFEQLAVYGRLLGVSVYQAKDRTSLALLLAQLQDKKIVLIDTVGVSTQDDKLQDLLHSLELPKLQKIFVTSAATQGDTIDRALRAHGVEKGHPIILTKLDEVERLGPAIDCVVRHGLTIAGLTDGQRVPEDWRSPDPLYLARQALLHPDDDPWQYEEPIAMSRLQSAEAHEKWAYV